MSSIVRQITTQCVIQIVYEVVYKEFQDTINVSGWKIISDFSNQTLFSEVLKKTRLVWQESKLEDPNVFLPQKNSILRFLYKKSTYPFSAPQTFYIHLKTCDYVINHEPCFFNPIRDVLILKLKSPIYLYVLDKLQAIDSSIHKQEASYRSFNHLPLTISLIKSQK